MGAEAIPGYVIGNLKRLTAVACGKRAKKGPARLDPPLPLGPE
jgi:hypothetical protein